MLFKRRFHDGIRSGTITTTIRAWQSPRVAVGGSYGFGASGRIEVDTVEQVVLGEIRAKDGRASGFDTVEELVAMLRKESGGSLNRRSKLFRVTFHYVGEHTKAPPALSLEELKARLERMDRRSKNGPWTTRVLRLIEKNPGVAAARLAAGLERKKAPFKADVRKLKKLGLTRSLEVGYELTKVGKALLLDGPEGTVN